LAADLNGRKGDIVSIERAASQFGEAPPGEVRVVHTSDVHVDNDYFAERFGGDGAGPLAEVVAAAARLRADLLLLVGDTFDHNRLPARVVVRAAEILAAFPGSVVILPGNHDPATSESPFRHPAFASLDHVAILGIGRGESAHLPQFGLEVCGRPHLDYADMTPLRAASAPRLDLRRIVLAHGHYEPSPDFGVRARPSWLFGDAELLGLDVDYVALGHWNRATRVGPGGVEAWYSGSPDVARSVNLIQLGPNGARVTREPLDP